MYLYVSVCISEWLVQWTVDTTGQYISEKVLRTYACTYAKYSLYSTVHYCPLSKIKYVTLFKKVRHFLEETASFSPRKWRTFWIINHEKSSFLPNFLRKTCQSGGIATTFTASTTAPYLPIYRAFQTPCGSVVANFPKFSRANMWNVPY